LGYLCEHTVQSTTATCLDPCFPRLQVGAVADVDRNVDAIVV
jgi:hypothetical protein